MFVTLYRILVCVVAIILAFFFMTFVSFHKSVNAGFAPTIWRVRWILTDGWLGVLYAVAFTAIAWLWRPASHNRRLALSDELPMDETDAEAYDIDSIARRASKEVPVGNGVSHDHVVFDVGDDDDDEDEDGDHDERSKRRRSVDEEARLRGADGDRHLLSSTDADDDDDMTPLRKGAKAD